MNTKWDDNDLTYYHLISFVKEKIMLIEIRKRTHGEKFNIQVKLLFQLREKFGMKELQLDREINVY